jgi:hypothetical protein
LQSAPKSAKKGLSRSISTDQIANVEPNTINPICFASEKELADDIELVIVQLNDTKGDWSRRLAALKHLQGLVYGGCTQFQNFPTLLHSLKEPLAKQLADLRSAIVKECCALLCAMVKVMGDDFEVYADYFMPSLFKLVITTIQIIADSGNQCIRTIITNSKITKSIPKILDSASSKQAHNTLRNRCSEYLLLLLEESNITHIEKYIDQIFVTVKICLGDATAGVRSNARKCFCAIQTHWRERARKFYTTLDSATQRAINEEEQKYERSGSGLLLDENHDPSSTPRPKSSQSNRSTARNIGPSSLTNVLKPNRPQTEISLHKSKSSVTFPTHYDLHSDEHDTKPNDATTKPPKPVVQQKKPTALSSIAAAKKAWLANNKKQLSKQSNDNAIPDVVITNNSNYRSKVNVEQRDEDNDLIFTEEAAYNPLPMPQRQPQVIQQPYQQAQPILYNNKVSSVGTNSNTKQTSTIGVFINQREQPDKPQITTLLHDNVPTAKQAPTSAKKLIPTKTVSTASSGVVNVATNESVTTILRDAKAILSSGSGATTTLTKSNETWNERVLCCQKLLYLIQSIDRWNELNTRFQDVMNVLLDKYVVDQNYKVALHALTVMDAMVLRYQVAIEPYLERIFAKALAKLNDPKQDIHDKSEKLLVDIGNNFSGDVLIPVLLKVIDNNSVKVKLACAEYMQHVFPTATSYLTHPSHMKMCIMKLNSQLMNINRSLASQIEEPITVALYFLYTTHPRMFLEQVLTLPLTEQSALKAVMSGKLPNLDNELAMVNKVSRTSTGEVQRKNSNGILMPRYDEEPEDHLNDVHNAEESSEEIQYGKYRSQNTANHRENGKPLSRNNSNGKVLVDTNNELKLLLEQLDQNKKDANIKGVRNNLVQLRSVSQSRDDSEEIWSLSFVTVLFAALDLIHHENESVREESLYLLKSLLQHHPMRFMETTTFELTFKRIMNKYTDSARVVHVAAEKAAETFIQTIDPLKSLELLKPLLLSAQEAIILGSLRLLRLLLSSTRAQPDCTLTPEVLRSHIPSLLTGIIEAFNHTNPDIRKMVVYCLAETMLTIGEQLFQPYLKRFSQNQIKLVNVYYQQLCQAYQQNLEDHDME